MALTSRSEVDIANAALAKLGAGLITSFEDGTAEAVAVRARFYFCADFVLRIHPWNCITKRVALAPDAQVPAYYYTQQFTLPSDFLKALDVSDDPEGQDVPFGERPQYALEGNKILMYNVTTCYLRYVAQYSDPNQLDEGCASAISAYLAYDISKILLQNDESQKFLYEQFAKLVDIARAENAQDKDTSGVADYYDIARRGW